MQRLFYLAPRLVSDARHRIARQFTPAGQLVLAGLVAAAVVGLDTNRTMAYQAFTFLLALLLVAHLSRRGFRPRVVVTRRLPRFATVGEPLSHGLIVSNEGSASIDGLLLRDQQADPRPTFREFAERAALGSASVRWSRLVAERKIADIAELTLPVLLPHGSVEVRPALFPLRRGRLQFEGTTLARPEPLGLMRALATIPAQASLLVLPKRYKMPAFKLPGMRKYQSGGVALASSVADSEEFVSLRDYRPGDPLRHIHWKSFAKAGKPIVKEYQDEFFVRHALVLDTFRGTTSDAVFEEAVSVAASLACSIETQESLLDLLFVESEVYRFTAGRGLGGVDHMLEVLACVQGSRDRSFSDLRDAVMRGRASLSGCICILLAWDEPRRGLVRDLQATGIPTLTLVIEDAGSPVQPSGDAGNVSPLRVHRLQVGRIMEGLARL